ncbi:MAG: transposase [Thaumarchaeota archaeon]|nr:transposase [Nitrososphaerota archaeon]
MIRAYAFRFYPNSKQSERLEETLELCRVLYNAALEQRRYARHLGQPISYHIQQNQLPELKGALKEFKQVYSQVLQNVLRRVDFAFKNFFDRCSRRKRGERIKAGYPRFKSSWRYNSFTYPQDGFKILPSGHIFLSKVGKLRVFMHRKIAGEIKTLTLKRDHVGDWFVVVTARLADVAQIQPKSALGVDIGLKNLVTLSSGDEVEAPKFFRESELKLRRAQKAFSHKFPGSNNRKKARLRLAKIHRKIGRQRDDFLHKLSRNLVRKTDLLIFENLHISDMTKNRKLAKSIHDASWGTLIRYASYKASSAGKKVEQIDPRGTTQRCSGCGRSVKKSLSDRVHRCPTCGLVFDRDLNAALNILDVGRGTPELKPAETRPPPPPPDSRGEHRAEEAGSPRLVVGGCHE